MKLLKRRRRSERKTEHECVCIAHATFKLWDFCCLVCMCVCVFECVCTNCFHVDRIATALVAIVLHFAFVFALRFILKWNERKKHESFVFNVTTNTFGRTVSTIASTIVHRYTIVSSFPAIFKILKVFFFCNHRGIHWTRRRFKYIKSTSTSRFLKRVFFVCE